METPSSEDLEIILNRIGFRDYKKRVYKTLFRLREASVTEINRASGVPMPKIYGIMDELERAGYVSLALARPRKYALVHPKIVFDKLLKEKESEISQLRLRVDKVVRAFGAVGPKLSEKFGVLRGRENVLRFLASVLDSNNKSYWASVAFNTGYTSLMPILKRKIKEGFDVRIIGPPGRDPIIRKYAKLGAKVKVVDGLKEPLRFSLHDGRFLALTLTSEDGEYVTILTDSSSLIKKMTTLFLYYWKIGRRR